MAKTAWKCATPECRNTKQFGYLCASCTTKQRHQRATKEIRPAVHPTGETRRVDGQPQSEMTDGRQRWWAVAQEVAA